MTTLGERLKLERRRFKLNQANFAAIGGVGKNMQFKYEKNRGVPDATYLINLSNYGVDVNWVLFGSLKPNTDQSVLGISSTDLSNDLIAVSLYVVDKNKEYTENKCFYFSKSLFIENNYPIFDIVIVVNRGDEMSPEINDEDWVLVDTQNKNTDGSAIAFRIGDCVSVNNVLLQDNYLVVSGVNRKFRPYLIDVSDKEIDLEILGNVIALLKKW